MRRLSSCLAVSKSGDSIKHFMAIQLVFWALDLEETISFFRLYTNNKTVLFLLKGGDKMPYLLRRRRIFFAMASIA
jgi:hypothetical protein